VDAEGTPFGRYRLIELIGRGGMGEVWRAYDTDTDRIIALKVLPQQLSQDEVFQERFRREAHAAAQLNDPHVIPIHHYGEIDGRLYVDMRLIEGRDLHAVLADGPLEPDRAVRIIEQVARALHAAHKVGLVHRDVKPSNVLLGEYDYAYLIDFGIARAAGETRMTATGGFIGSWHYMAPERFSAREADARVDVYALACVLYECLTGQTPYPGDSLEQQYAGHVATPQPRPSSSHPDLPTGFDRVIERSLAKDPEHRYATTIELANAARAAVTVPVFRPTPAPARPVTEPAHSRIPAATFARDKQALERATNSMHLAAGATAGQASTQGSPHPPPRQPWGAPELTTSKRPSRRTKIALVACVMAAVLAVLTAAVFIGFNIFGDTTRGVQVPNVRGQASTDAVAALQKRGLKTRTQQKPDSTIPPDHVIGTEPGANTSMSAGDLITIDVSTGPEQRPVPDVSSLSYADAVNKLQAAGFSRFNQAPAASGPELKDKVIGTNPPANQMSSTTAVIIVIVGSGAQTKPLPDVAGQTVEVAQMNLTVYGFTKFSQTQVDSPRPAGEVIGTNPPKGAEVAVDAVIELQVSKGNQFVMPDLSGMFWTDAEPRLRALGWTGVLDKGPNVDAGPSQHNRIVHQAPAAGAGANRDATITLNWGQ
jgi:eukaryotic-like serine/threonine-protein kinase